MLALRCVVGVTFLMHGLEKLGHPSTNKAFLASLGMPAPAVIAPSVAATETVGGALLVAGTATPLAGVALASDMLVAYLTYHKGKGFFVSSGGYELVLLLGGADLAIALAGPGRFSGDAALSAWRG